MNTTTSHRLDGGTARPTGRAQQRPWISRDTWLVIAVTLAGFAVWELAVRWMQVPQFILPSPWAIAGRVAEDFTSGLIFPHFLQTLLEVLVGFLLATLIGVGLGTAVALVGIVERVVYPFVLALQTVPKVAVAPLFIIWFGFGIEPKIVTAAVIAFFPILVNVIAGLKATDPRRLLLMRALKAGRWTTFCKVQLPGMLPYLFAGLEVGIIFAVIGAIVGEFIGASLGLGSLVIQRQASIDVAGVFSVLFYLSFMGVALNLALRWVARRWVFWERPTDTVSA